MTGTPGHIELERSIDSIRIGLRHRADLGDIDALAASIERQGLLQPITVTPDGVLVCGARRLAALRQLGVRKLNVWVRAGISDRLTELLAEQDDNTLHKPLSPTESATLYRELKHLLAEEAARRQEASRFHANGENPRSDGGADSAPPSRGVGRSREQAARLVTGHGSYSRLEQIGDLQQIAGDERTDASVRALAVAELDGIDRGGAVSSAHQRVSAHHSLAELEAIAADLSRPAGVRHASSVSAARLHAVERTASAAELEQLAREALARVKAAKKSTNGSHRPGSARTTSTSDEAKLPVRAFVFLWGDLHAWWTQYDVAELSVALTDEQWEQFEETLAGTIAFAESLQALRARARTAAR
ncbi:ParB/RepB/Spo0J family partition protein [Agromyces albus]|uniref:ParB/RepB/Spo0J family partition protein n=1 Tax=Agromyces albus TaxID=205332 RepID=UPI00277F2F97|nr:ParB N-terminal domain-containing protein [Agromyces albus]MDQ0575239.1 ParB family chromosome partitioning protein [Agromyces albus]